MTPALVVSGVAAVAAFAIWKLRRRESREKARKIKEAFLAREPLTPEMFYERYFRDKGVSFQVVEGIREILEQHLEADLSRLSDEDDFSQNLRFFWDFDSMADVEIVCALEKRFQIEILDAEAENMHTVADFVQLVSRKTGGPSVP